MNKFNLIKLGGMIDDMTKHGLIMVAFGILGGLFNYLYQLAMGVLLPTQEYGVLFSLTSLFVILIVVSQAITIAVAKFTSKLVAEGRLGGVNYVWRLFFTKMLLAGIGGFAILALLSPLLSRFLKLDSIIYPIIVFSAIFIVLMLSVNLGTLQGLQKFVPLGSSQVLAGFLRLVLGVFLVQCGFGVQGALTAIPVAFFLVLIFTFLPLRNLLSVRNERVSLPDVRSYAGLTLLAISCVTVLINIDVILAKHYLTATDAGNYSAMSVLGRVAFYAPVGIAAAMFPKTSELFERSGDHRGPFARAMILTVLIAGSVVVVYALFPHHLAQFLFDGKYPLIGTYLATYGLAMGFLAVSFLAMSYLLSLNQTKVAFSLLGVMLLEIFLIVAFHSGIGQMVNVLLACAVLSPFSMLPFFHRHN